MNDRGLEVLVIRHGIAEDAGPGMSDAERALTDKGITRMRMGSAGLQWLEPTIDVLAHSPLRRAVETARLLAEAYRASEVREVSALAPTGDGLAILRWAAGLRASGIVAVVGHEPDLGVFIATALGADAPIPLKKGGGARVAFPGTVSAGSGMLRWLLPPRALRRLGAAGGARA